MKLHRNSRVRLLGLAIALPLLFVACGSDTQTAADSTGATSTKLVVGSQDYYSNEILAEIYAQALEKNGYTVDRQFRIGQREVYLPEITNGKIDVFPEYIGSLLQTYDAKANPRSTNEAFSKLTAELPSGLSALTPSTASDQNSWTVTRAFAEKNDLSTIESLKKVKDSIVVGGNSELETRPYGPKSLEDRYGIKVSGFKAVEDSGGPLTVKALTSGDIQLANIYTADPNIETNDLVTLDDPDGLFLPDNIAPLVSARVDDRAREILNKVSGELTQEDFVGLNAESVNAKTAAKAIAATWLAAHP